MATVRKYSVYDKETGDLEVIFTSSEVTRYTETDPNLVLGSITKDKPYVGSRFIVCLILSMNKQYNKVYK
jgi:hypothetical protein